MLRIWVVTVGVLAFITNSYSQYSWKRYCELKSSRQYFQALYIGNNEILVIGGFTNITSVGTGNPTRSCEIINTVNGTSVYTDSMSSAKAEFIALLNPDSNVVAISGLNQQSGQLTSQVELYDRKTKKWRVLGDLLVARRQHAAVMINKTEILIVGGRRADLSSIATAEIFDISTGITRLVQDYPSELNTVNLAIMQNGFIVGFGGREGGENSSRPRDINRYDSSANVWTRVGGLPTGVNGTGFINAWDGRLFINGGGLSESPVSAATWTYLEGINGNFTALGNMQHDRRWHYTAQFTTDTMLISGGWDVQIFPRRSVDWVNLSTGQVTPGPLHIEPHAWHQLVSVPIAKNGQNIPTRGKLFAISGMKSTDSATRLVEVLDLCFAKPNIIANRRSICSGDTTLIDAGRGFAAYRWNTGARTQTIVVRDSGRYWVEVTDSTGCMGRDTVTLNVNPKPSVSILVLPSDTLCRGQVANISVIGGDNSTVYQWSPSAGLNVTTIANPQLNIAFAGTYTYTVTATNVEGCSDTASVNLVVKPCGNAIAITSKSNTQSLSICDSLLSSIFITNDSSLAVTIDSASLGGGVQIGATLDPLVLRQVNAQLFPITILPKSSREVPIRIIPTGVGNYSIDVLVYYGGKSQVFSIIGKSFKRTLQLKLLGANTEFNKNFELPVYVQSQHWNEFKVNDIELTILYDKKRIEFIGNLGIQVSPSLQNTWKVTDVSDNLQLGRISVRLQSVSPTIVLSKDDTLMSVTFRLLLPDTVVTSIKPELSYVLPNKHTDCFDNLSQTQPISVIVCGASIRPVKFGDVPFKLTSVAPNPTNSTLTIRYGVGFESQMKLKLYDVNGREVSTLYDGVHKEGLYEAIVDVSGLSEGVYYCTMTSAVNIFTQQVLIVR